MLVRARDMLTWGEVDHKTLTRLLSKRLRSKMAGNRKVDEQVLKQVTGFNSFDQFAQALLAGKVKLKDFSQLKLTFRLTPPSGGFKSVREHWPRGDLGYRGKKINELLERMM
jgi:large subunit ribosomal protein L30